MEVNRNSEPHDTKFASVRNSAPSVEPVTNAVSGKPSALIVSDVRLYREGLAMTLRSRSDLMLAGTADSLKSAVELIGSLEPTIVLLDTGMPRGLEIARALVRAAPRTKVVAVAVSDDSADVVACAEAGIAGYVSRDGSVEDVVAAIHDVVRGEFSCPPRMISTLFKRLASLAPHHSDSNGDDGFLTKREIEIVSLIDEGLSNKEIGGRLRIGTPTVKNHVHHILEKLHVRRRGQAAAAVRAKQALPSLSVKRRRADESRNDRMD
jgi:two-component system, NarL family, nitrate/nitrite response regulator NarL